jgi:hypothetical protein
MIARHLVMIVNAKEAPLYFPYRYSGLSVDRYRHKETNGLRRTMEWLGSE